MMLSRLIPVLTAAICANLALAAGAAARAEDDKFRLKGPAAGAVRQYLQTNAIDCDTAEKADNKCTIASIVTRAKMFYGRMPGDAARYAVAFIDYEPPGGNAMYQMAIVFRSESGGPFAPVGRAEQIVGTNPRNVRFGRGVIIYTGTVLGPNDARCCPTASKAFTLRLSGGGMSFVDSNKRSDAGGAGAPKQASADDRLVGIWLGLHEKVEFPLGCNSGEPVRYSSDGTYMGPGVRGTWKLREGRLMETAKEAYPDLGGDPADIGKPHISDIAWEGLNTFVKTFSDGARMTFRRCPTSVGRSARAYSSDTDSPVREQIARACKNKPGMIEPASVIERDLTGDGKADRIIHHEGIVCEGGRSIFCGAQECSANLYVRRGAQLYPAGAFGAVEWIKIGDRKIPTIHTVSHGGKPLALRWNGHEFRVVSARLPSQPAARSKAADYLVREQIAEACEGKTGTIDPAAVIERDLTGDGRSDLIISHEGIACAGGGRSGFCGGQVCSVNIYVRRGALLKLEREMLGAGIRVGRGAVPAINMYAHGGRRGAIRWNGWKFR